MSREKPLLVHKKAGKRRHYLILNEDRQGKEWKLPRYEPESSIEEFMDEKLDITSEDLEEIEKDTKTGAVKVEVKAGARATVRSKDNKGGIFVKRKEAAQLLNSKSHRKTLEKHSRALNAS
jgi:predicted metal-dependent hydrolase